MPTTKDSPTAGEIAQNDVPKGDTAAPAETNFPPAAVEDILPDAVVAEDEVASDGEPGEIWAIYTGQQPSQRILTVENLRQLGDSNAKEPLKWFHENRYRLNVTDVHPMVLEYIEELDGNFRVVRP